MPSAVLLDLLWLGGTALCVGALAYGGFLVYDYHCRASEAALRAVARLALHDSHREFHPDDGEAARP